MSDLAEARIIVLQKDRILALEAALRDLLVEVDIMTKRVGWSGNGGRERARALLLKVRA